jgi:hypothetical protein
MLKKTYIRNGKGGIIGSQTTGFSGGGSVVRDADEQIIGRTSERFGTTRDAHGNLISLNTADAGLLFGNDDDE